ncbi:DsrE family protein [Candidatus Woesearchaeota archaeon]|nr:DsrE family protein [Candidatus Woesearchaeota archaeon]
MAKMKNVLIVVLAGKETHEGMARVSNALVIAKEFKEAGYNISIIFDGAGTEWLVELQKADNKLHDLYSELVDVVAGVCDFCSAAFNVKDALKAQGTALSSQYMGHPSFKKYVEEGYEIITF